MKKIYLSNVLYLPILIIALIMVLSPQFIIDFFNLMISLLFMVNGIHHLVDGYILKNHRTDYNPLIIGILSLSVGLIILLSEISLLNILPTVIGLFCLMYSFSILLQLLKIKDLRNIMAINKIIAGAVALILGLFLLTNADLASELLIRVLGVVIMIVVFNLSINFYNFKQQVPKVKRIKKK